jgi:hypothetical protein
MADDPIRIPIETELDLHAFAPRDITPVVSDYIDAAVLAGLRDVRLVHGRSTGVQRGIVQAALDRHPSVVEFHDDQPLLGATVARLAMFRLVNGGGYVSAPAIARGTSLAREDRSAPLGGRKSLIRLPRDFSRGGFYTRAAEPQCRFRNTSASVAPDGVCDVRAYEDCELVTLIGVTPRIGVERRFSRRSM